MKKTIWFALLTSAVASPSSGAFSEIPLSVAPHLQAIEASQLWFSDGHWHKGVEKLPDLTPLLVNSDRAYVVVEAFVKDLSGPAQLRLIDAQGHLLDTLNFKQGSSEATKVSIPVASANLHAQVVEADGIAGSVVIARVLAPPPPGDVPHGYTPMLTPIVELKRTADPGGRALYQAGRAVALVQVAGNQAIGACTGFLVRRDVLATAAHCVQPFVSDLSHGCDQIGVVFDVQGDGSLPIKSVHCRAVRYLNERSELVTVKTIPATQVDSVDLALLTLDPDEIKIEPQTDRSPLALSESIVDPIGSIISYPQGQEERYSTGCAVSAEDKIIYHRCNTTPGSSGAPLLQWKDYALVVVGIHVCCANGVPISGDTVSQLVDSQGVVNIALKGQLILGALGQH